MEEIWKDIVGYEEIYQVSNFGNVKNIRTNKILKYGINDQNYEIVTLYKKTKKKNMRIHRLVAQAFIPNPDNLPQINHKDGNKHNNRVDNLEWCTGSNNIKHAYINDLNPNHRIVGQYDKNGNLINVFISTNEAGIITKISQRNIHSCASGKRKTAGNYIWKFLEGSD